MKATVPKMTRAGCLIAVLLLLAALASPFVLPPTTASAAPSAPSGLTATLVNPGRIDLAWTDTSTGETGFHIITALDAAFTGSLTFTVGPNVTTYSDVTVYAGATFYYKVTSFDATGDSASSNVASVFIPLATATVPAAPGALTAVAVSGTQVNLSWTDNSNNEVGFLVDRAGDAGFVGGLVTYTLAAGTTTYSDTPVTTGVTYYYRVSAYNALGNSSPSNAASVTPGVAPPSAPNAPSGLTAVAAGANLVNLTWVDNAGNETGFRIDRARDAGFTQSPVSFQAAANSTTYADTTTAAATAYFYRVVALGATNSAPSNAVSVTTLDTPPSAPSGLTAVAAGANRVNLTWVDNAGNETGFRIDRATDAAFTIGLTALNVAANALTLADTSTVGGITYYYRVLALNASGTSASSNVVPVTTPSTTSALVAPTALTATMVSSSRIDLAWTYSSTGQSGFHIDTATDAAFSIGRITFTASADARTYNDVSVYGGATFYYRVTAFNGAGDSPASNTASVYVPLLSAGVPVAPSGLTAAPVGTTQANLAWLDNSSDEVGFLIERAGDSGFASGLVSFTLGPNIRSYSDMSLVSGATYYFRVTAFNALGSSPASNVASVGPGAISGPSSSTSLTVPLAPAGLTASAGIATQVNLGWVVSSSNESGFRVERATDAAFSSNKVSFPVAAGTMGYADVSTTGSTAYYYRVFAFNAAGDSSPSNIATVTTPAGSSTSTGSGSTGTVTSTPTRVNLSGFRGAAILSVDQTGRSQAPAQLASLDGKVTIGIAGGTRLMNANGAALTTISQEELIVPPPAPPSKVILTAYELGPEGAKFDPPIDITIKYDALPAGVKEADLQVTYWDGAQWQSLPSTLNTVAKTVSARVEHFSRFSVMGKVAGPAVSAGSANFGISSLVVTPVNGRLAEPVAMSVVVTNYGNAVGTFKVVLKLNGDVEDSQSVTLGAGDTQKVSFTVAKEAAGSYKVDINGLGTTFLVSGTPVPKASAPSPSPSPAAPRVPDLPRDSSNWLTVWVAVGAVATGGLLVFLLGKRRRRIA